MDSLFWFPTYTINSEIRNQIWVVFHTAGFLQTDQERKISNIKCYLFSRLSSFTAKLQAIQLNACKRAINHKTTCFCICAKIHRLPLCFLFYYICSHRSIDHLDVFSAAIIISWDEITYIKSLLRLHVYCAYLTHRFTWQDETEDSHRLKPSSFSLLFLPH